MPLVRVEQPQGLEKSPPIRRGEVLADKLLHESRREFEGLIAGIASHLFGQR